MFVADATAPTALRLSFQWFRMPSASSGVLVEFGYQFKCFLVCFWLTLQQTCNSLFRFRGKNDFVSVPIDDGEYDYMELYYKKPNGDWINALTGEALSSVTQFKIKNIDLVNQY